MMFQRYVADQPIREEELDALVVTNSAIIRLVNQIKRRINAQMAPSHTDSDIVA